MFAYSRSVLVLGSRIICECRGGCGLHSSFPVQLMRSSAIKNLGVVGLMHGAVRNVKVNETLTVLTV